MHDLPFAQFHPPMLVLALATSFLGTLATVVLGRHAAMTTHPAERRRWMLLAVFAVASATWADSVTAMLAYPTRAHGFAPWPMVASFVLAFVLLGVAAQVTIARADRAPMLGGVIAGIAISAVHYIGIQAFVVAGTIEWDWRLIALGVVVGIVCSTIAATTWVQRRARSSWLPIVLFALAIFGDHVITMSAATVVHDDSGRLREGLIDEQRLTAIVGVIAILVAGSTWVARAMHRRSRRRTEADKAQLQQLAEVADEGIVICDGSEVVWFNRSLETMLTGPSTGYVGAPIESLLAIGSIEQVAYDREVDAQLRLGSTADATAPIRVVKRAISMGGRPHLVVSVRDQRARLHEEAELRRRAQSDALTGLANRAEFNRVLLGMFASLAAAPPGFALLSLDLDRFKQVNDTYGHAAGDAVLVEVATRLVALVREGDFVARLGGDEFAILAVTGSDPGAIAALADRAIETMSQPFVADGRHHRIGVSLGIAFARRDGSDPETLSRNADLALYRAKAEGRGTHRRFEPHMRIRMQERYGMEDALRQALERDEFRVFYQPQVDAKTGVFNGAEALIRWMHPTRGLVPPSEFIPLAEETGQISAIGDWVLRRACADAAAWPGHLPVAVNLSPTQFRDPTLVQSVASALAWSGMPGHRLELEITENVLIEDTARVKSVLDELKALGIRLSLDDFGTGYSSLGHLHRFPFDKIKIDRTFVRGLPADAGGAAIIRAVVALAAGLGMQTTAEGVEDESQRAFVQATGCDQIQGFLFGRPVPVEALPDAFRVSKGQALRAEASLPWSTLAGASRS